MSDDKKHTTTIHATDITHKHKDTHTIHHKLSIVIPVYNQWQYTRYCLEHFQTLNPAHEVIIVNNGSTDRTSTEMNSYLKDNIKVINNDINKGFGSACDSGFQLAKNEVVLFLNNDIKIIDKNLEFFNSFAHYVVSMGDGYLIGPTGGMLDKQGNFMYETNDSSKEINYMSGWFLAATKSTFQKLTLPGNLGPFDAKTYFCYFEDSDLGLRARDLQMKFQLYNVPITHIGKQTTKTLNINKLFTTSKKQFLKKWAGKI